MHQNNRRWRLRSARDRKPQNSEQHTLEFTRVLLHVHRTAHSSPNAHTFFQVPHRRNMQYILLTLQVCTQICGFGSYFCSGSLLKSDDEEWGAQVSLDRQTTAGHALYPEKRGASVESKSEDNFTLARVEVSRDTCIGRSYRVPSICASVSIHEYLGMS